MNAPSSPSMGASTFEVAGEGERVLSPKQLGLKALEVLEQLVILHRQLTHVMLQLFRHREPSGVD